MKKQATMVVLTITLCCLMMASVGIASGFKAGYSNMSYALANTVTWDGKWTSATEWVDAMPSNFGQNAAYREKYDFQMSGDTFTVYFDCIIETWDNTNDAGDFYQLSLCGQMDGGTTPKTDDYKVEVYGHAPTATVQWYKGTGTGWANISTPSAAFKWAEASATSPTTAAAHYSCEMQIPKSDLGTQAEFWVRVAYYDAHAGGYGLQSWPPNTSVDNPNDYGDIPYTMDPIPEGFNAGIILALTAVVVVAGAVLVRKRTTIPKFVTI